jgi:hypothetical protein
MLHKPSERLRCHAGDDVRGRSVERIEKADAGGVAGRVRVVRVEIAKGRVKAAVLPVFVDRTLFLFVFATAKASRRRMGLPRKRRSCGRRSRATAGSYPGSSLPSIPATTSTSIASVKSEWMLGRTGA